MIDVFWTYAAPISTVIEAKRVDAVVFNTMNLVKNVDAAPKSTEIDVNWFDSALFNTGIGVKRVGKAVSLR